MNAWIAMLLLFCATQVLSCAAYREPAATGTSPEKQESSSFPAITLGDRDGPRQLSLRRVWVPGQKRWANVLGLRAYDEELLGTAAAGTVSDLWLDGEAVSVTAPDGAWIIDRQSSNDWSYVAVAAPAQPGRVRKLTRHLLHVEPDLFVVWDEIVLAEQAMVEVAWWFPAGVARDSAREEWRLQLPGGGVTARILGSPRNSERLWPAGAVSQPQPATGRDAVCVRSGTTNKTAEFSQVTALIPHERDARRSLAFKLLESDTAIGLRVHRDGLPTLVAFRKCTVVGEANLTGLKFNSPVAVDIFRPRRK